MGVEVGVTARLVALVVRALPSKPMSGSTMVIVVQRRGADAGAEWKGGRFRTDRPRRRRSHPTRRGSGEGPGLVAGVGIGGSADVDEGAARALTVGAAGSRVGSTIQRSTRRRCRRSRRARPDSESQPSVRSIGEQRCRRAARFRRTASASSTVPAAPAEEEMGSGQVPPKNSGWISGVVNELSVTGVARAGTPHRDSTRAARRRRRRRGCSGARYRTYPAGTGCREKCRCLGGPRWVSESPLSHEGVVSKEAASALVVSAAVTEFVRARRAPRPARSASTDEDRDRRRATLAVASLDSDRQASRWYGGCVRQRAWVLPPSQRR